jgi:pimeloyl-ACP methyl ester carboxylesterase
VIVLAAGLIATGLVGLGWLWAHSRRGWREAERASPPLGAFIEVSGCRLHYVEAGEGTPVVLVHGASGNLRDMTLALAERLAKNHRVLAFDRPGYGYSSRPPGPWPDPARQARYLREALAALGVERPVLVGHSWAGSLVLAYALAWPKELRGVVAISPASHAWPGGVVAYRVAAQLPLLGPLLAHTVLWPLGQRMADAALRSTFHPDPLPDGYRGACGIDLLFRPVQFRADGQDVGRLSQFLAIQSARYAELATPLTILVGTRDAIVSPRRHAHALHAQVAGSRLVVVDGAGHALHHAHPDTVAAEIAALAAQGELRLRT